MSTGEIRTRDTWDGRTAFIMAAIGSAVGLGNLWRFPYVAYSNGGGAFLIPYFIALITTGIPLMILEFGVGFINQGSAPLSFKKIKDKYEWIGWWGVLVGSVIVIYYMVVMSWSLSYLWYSFDLSWKKYEVEKAYFSDKNDYNILLKNDFIEEKQEDNDVVIWNKMELSEGSLNDKLIDLKIHDKPNIINLWKLSQKSSNDFFFKNVLDISKTSINSKFTIGNNKYSMFINVLEQDKENDNLIIKTNDETFFHRKDLKNILGRSITFKIDDTVFKEELVGTINDIILDDKKGSAKIKLQLIPPTKKALVDSKILSPFSQIFEFKWKLVLGLAVAWILVYFIIYKGVSRVGAIVKWTVPLPILLLLVILIKALTMEGSLEGIKYYLVPDFEVLKDPKVWLAAYSQIFFSLSIGFGILIAYASYLPKNSEINNNAHITSFVNCATSYFAGFAVFSIIGYLAFSQGTPIGETMKGGPGLTFVAFPTALAKLPMAKLFSALFFITLLSLGIDSAFSLVEAITSAIHDRVKLSKQKVTLLICIIGFILGLLFTSRAGLYWLDVVDHWMNNFGLVLVGLAECIIIGYMINIKKFRNTLNKHSDIKIGKWWEVCVKYITPTVLLYFVGNSVLTEIEKNYGGYPDYVINSGGWGVAIILVLAAMFLMQTGHKWKYKLKTFTVIIIISLLALKQTALAMFIFGCVILFGGSFKYLWIALHGKNKNIIFEKYNETYKQSFVGHFLNIFGMGPVILFNVLFFAFIAYLLNRKVPLPLFDLSELTVKISTITIILLWLVVILILFKNYSSGKNKKFRNVGIYKYIRHPMYSLTTFCGIIIAILLYPTVWMLAALIFIYIIAQILAEYEEEAMLDLYGDAYADYIKNTGRFFPLLFRE